MRRRSELLLYGFVLCQRLEMHQPFLYPILYDICKSATLVGVVSATQQVAIVVCELPSGLFADRYGTTWTLFIATLTSMLELLALALAMRTESVLLALLSAILFGLASGLVSGTVEAAFTKADAKAGSLKKYVRNLSIINEIGDVISPSLGALCVYYHGHAALVFSALIPQVFSLFALNGIEKDLRSEYATLVPASLSLWEQMIYVKELFRTNTRFCGLILACSVFNAVGETLILFGPVLYPLYGIDSGHVAPYTAVATVFAILGGACSEYVPDSISTMLQMQVAFGVSVVALGVGQFCAHPVFLLVLGFSWGFFFVLINDEILHEAAQTSSVATIISISSTGRELLFGAVTLTVGPLIDCLPLWMTMMYLAGVMWVLSAVAMRLMQLAPATMTMKQK